MLLPLAQRIDWQVEGAREFSLVHSQSLTEHFDARYAAHAGQLLRCGRLRIRIGQRRRDDFLISDRVQASPIGRPGREGLTSFHGHPRNTCLAHDVQLSAPK